MMKTLFAATMALVTTSTVSFADTVIFFRCDHPSMAEEVAYTVDMIPGISPLPGGCEWLVSKAVIRKSVKAIVLSNGKTVFIAEVDGTDKNSGEEFTGFSVGYLLLTS